MNLVLTPRQKIACLTMAYLQMQGAESIECPLMAHKAKSTPAVPDVKARTGASHCFVMTACAEMLSDPRTEQDWQTLYHAAQLTDTRCIAAICQKDAERGAVLFRKIFGEEPANAELWLLNI